MFARRPDRPGPGFAVLYGVSANTRGWWDLAPGRALGYDPQDDAEAFAARSGRRRRATPSEAAHVGGPYATAQFERPALDRLTPAPPRDGLDLPARPR